MTVELPRRFKSGRIGVSDVRTEPDGINLWTTRWTGEQRDIPMPLGTGGGYVYRRDVSGYIYPGPSASTDQERFRILGSVFLPEYGEHEGGPDVMGREYDMLLRLGGGKEMPAQQVIDLGWAAQSPEVDGQPVWTESPLEAFPQLAGATWSALRRCPYCPRHLWSDEMEQNHVSVMHGDRLLAYEQANAIASGMKEAVAIGRQSVETPPEIVAPIPEPTPVPISEPEPVPEPEEAASSHMICGFCGEGFMQVPTFLKHIKQCRESRRDQGS